MIYEIVPYGRTTGEKYFRVFLKSLKNSHEAAKCDNSNNEVFKQFQTVIITDKLDDHKEITYFKRMYNLKEDFAIVIAPKNSGAGKMRNLGLEFVKKDFKLRKNVKCYFTFLDSDDMVNKKYYIYKGKNTDLIQTRRVWWKGIFRMNMDKPFNKIKTSEELLTLARKGEAGEQVWGRLYSIKFLDFKFKENGIWEDGIYLRKILETNPSISYNKYAKYYWRRNNTKSLTISFSDLENYKASKDNLKELIKDSNDHNVDFSCVAYNSISLLESFKQEELKTIIKDVFDLNY